MSSSSTSTKTALLPLAADDANPRVDDGRGIAEDGADDDVVDDDASLDACARAAAPHTGAAHAIDDIVTADDVVVVVAVAVAPRMVCRATTALERRNMVRRV